MPRKRKATVIVPFKRGKAVADLRTHLDGPMIMGNISKSLNEIENIEAELEDSIKQFEREDVNKETGEVTTVQYTSTTLDKETIAVYHTRLNARKMQIDTNMKMLNKIIPDLKAVETNDDIANAAERALRAFARSASEE